MRREAPKEKARRRGQSAAARDVERGAGAWIDFDSASGHTEIHPELGVPVRAVPKPGFDVAERADLESFVRAYNEELLAAHAAGKLRDFRPRVLSAGDFEQRFAGDAVVRLPRNGSATSPDGRYVIASSNRTRCITLRGPGDAAPTWLCSDLDTDFDFLPDGETVLCRTTDSFWVTDLPTRVTFSFCPRAGTAQRVASEGRADRAADEARVTASRGAGDRIDKRELTELRLSPGAVLEGVHLERCTLLDCTAGAPPERGGAAEWYAGRSVVRDVTLSRCELVRCEASSVVFQNVVLDRTALRASNLLDGCLFDRVTVRGHVGTFAPQVANWTRSLTKHQEVGDEVARLHARFYENVEWALDLTGLKSGRVDIGDIPVELVRVNPAICFMMSRDHAMTEDFRKVAGVEYTDLAAKVLQFRETARPSLLLVADPRSKSFALDLAALRNLRSAGLVT